MRPPTMRPRGLLRTLVPVLALMASTLAVVVTVDVVRAPTADASQATGGTGRYRDMIQWISWGGASEQITGTSKTVTETTVIAGQSLKTTCTISGIAPTGGLEAYRPGQWQGDGFDDMYNVGGVRSNNQLIVGLSNRTAGTNVTFTYSCSATLGGSVFPLAGLVVADAETSGGSSEWVGATPLAPAGGSVNDVTWRMIDRGRGANCSDVSYAYRFATSNRLEMFGPASNTCEGTDSTRWPGASAVAFMEGATAANVTVKGGGKSAIALGVSLQFDFGDAPASYGDAGAALQFTWGGGTVQGRTPGSTSASKPVSASGTDRGDDVFAMNLATVQQPAQRLGAVVDPELDPAGIRGTTATGDDTSGNPAFGGPDDEDALSLGTPENPTQLVMTPGEKYVLDQPITFHGAGKVAAWLDLNGNGTFDSGERSANTLTASGGKLEWNIPADFMPNGGVRTTYLRLRMVDTDETPQPTGISNAGEVEDYRVRVATPPRFTLTKNIGTRVDPQDQFTVGATGPGVSAGQVQVVTSGTESTRSTTTRLVQVGGAYTLTDTMTAGSANPISDYKATASCVDTAASSAPVALSGTGPWTTASLAAGQYVVCTVTNTARDAQVEVTKTFEGVEGPTAAGEYTARYRVTVANPGPQATSYGQLLDQPEFAANLQVLGATWSGAATSGTAPGSGTATGGGPFTLAPASTTLARRATHTYQVSLRFRYRNQTQAVGCSAGTGGLRNTVSLPAGQETGGSTDNSACADAPAPPTRTLTLDKQTDPTGALVDTNGNGRTDAGDTVRYRFVVTNTGQTTLTDLQVNDPLVTHLTCPTTTLAPGATTSCTAVHVLTQADVDAGSFDNTATVTGTDPIGDPVTSPPDSTSTPLLGADSLALTKTHDAVVDANTSGRLDAGDQVRYHFTVTNTGTRTVTNPTVNDPMFPGTITCSPSPLAPGATAICGTRTLTLTQAHLNAGHVDNTATATAQRGTSPVTSQPAHDRVDLPATPALLLDKQVVEVLDTDSSGTTGAGDTLRWSFRVTNTGTVTLTDVSVTDPLAGPVTCLATSLAPGATVDCTQVVHTVTGAEAASGSVRNVATAQGTPPSGAAVTSRDETETPVVASAPALEIVKTAGTPVDVNASGLTDAGDRITWTFTVTNTGNVPMREVSARDPRLGTLPAECTAATLAPGASFTCSATGTVTAAEQTAGAVVNTATATGTPPGVPGTTPEPVDSPPARTSTPVTAPDPALRLVKQAGTPRDVNESGNTDAGDVIDYTFTVTNGGNVPLTAVQVLDPKLGTLPVSCGPQALAPGASFTCTASYTVTAADESAGEVLNSATATGVPPGEGATPPTGAVTSPPSRTTTEVVPPGPALAVVKRATAPVDANGTGITDAGDTLSWTFTVTNTGNVPLRQVSISDPLLDGATPPVAITCPSGPLAPGASRTCTSAPWTITLAQEQAGTVRNTATATGTPPGGPPVTSEPDTSSTPVTAQAPALEVVKKAGTPVDVNASGITDAGDTITYSFTVTNTGNVPLTALSVQDPKLAAAGVAVTCATGPLAPGESLTCTSAPYTVSAADEADQKVRNSATVTGTPPRGPAVQSPPSTTTTTVVVPSPSLTVDKQAGTPVDVNSSGLTDAGDTVRYSFTVTNTGNVPVHGVTVVDPTLAGQASPEITVTCAQTTLAPGTSTQCSTSAPYTVTPGDVASGAVHNSAHATATDPDQDPLTSPPDSTSVPTTRPLAALRLVKRAGSPVDVNSSGLTDAGDTVRYSFTVTNTGNVPVRQVSVNDPVLAAEGITLTCAVSVLAPGASTECTTSAPHVVTSAEVKGGAVHNVATAVGTDPDNGPVRSPEASTTTPTTAPRPALSVAKEVTGVADRNSSGITDAGDTITWRFTVTNTGNVPVRQVVVEDPLLAAAGIVVACPTGTLAPGASRVCTAAPYSVTEADEKAAVVANTATARGTDPDGDPVASPPSRTTTPVVTPQPALEVEKTAGVPVDVNSSGITDAGDTIAYRFQVTNVGNVPVQQVAIDDPRLDAAGIQVTCVPGTLAPGAVAVCTPDAPAQVTRADVEARAAHNSAAATGSDPDGNPVRSPEDSTSTPTTSPSAGLSVLKEVDVVTDVNSSGITDAGDRVGYRFTVTNTGNVPVRALSLQDPLLQPAPVCEATTLLPGASTRCTTSATHTVTAADESAGAVRNTATVSGTDPDGDPVTSPPDSVTVPVTTPAPALVVDKQLDAGVGAQGWEDLDGSGLVDAGDRISYRLTARNTGNVPLDEVHLVDPRAVSTAGCGPHTLAVGQEISCSVATVVTAADVSAGSVSNTATARGTDPDGDPVLGPPDTVTVPTTTPAPALAVAKTAGVPVDVNGSGLTDAGDVITYTFTVTNTGNVPLREVHVVDPKLGALPGACTVPVLGVGAVFTCSAQYTVTAQDTGSGAVHNSATATGTPPGTGTPPVTSPRDSTTTPTTRPEPLVEVVKEAGTPVDLNASGLTDAGDVITYTFTVTNTGNVPVTGVQVQDTKLTDQGITVTCAPLRLTPGQTATCLSTGGGTATSGGYRITADDVASGAVTNTATVRATTPDNTPVTSPPDTVSVPTRRPRPAIVLDKQVVQVRDVNASGITDAGDLVRYGFVVTNSGNVPLRTVRINDATLTGAAVPVTLDCGAGPLAPGSSRTCLVGGGVAAPDSTLGWYRVTGADVASGAVTNTATATASDPDAGVVTSPPDSVSVPVIAPEPQLMLDKSVGALTTASGGRLEVETPANSGVFVPRDPIAGDRVTWQFAVTNSGNVPVGQVTVHDPMLAAPLACGAPTSGVVLPGQTVHCSGSSILTQAQINAGKVTNTATVTGRDPDGGPVTSPPDTATTPLSQRIEVGLTKAVDHVEDTNGSGLTDAGDLVSWRFQLTNRGNVTLTDVVLEDPLLTAQNPAVAVACLWPGASGVLPAGSSIPCESVGASVVTSADVAAGKQTNRATVTATAGATTVTDEASASVATATPQPRLTLVKTAGAPVDRNGSGLTDAGDQISWTFRLTNAGNVPLTQVQVSDPKLAEAGISVSCPVTRLGVGESTECSADAPWTVTAADVAAGAVLNTAVGRAFPPGIGTTPPTSQVSSPPATSTTPTTTPQPGLGLVKSRGPVVDVNASGLTDAGDTVTYGFALTNTGNVPLRNVQVVDAKLGVVGGTCVPLTLQPGETVRCISRSYVMRPSDVVEGGALNTATLTGTDPDQNPVTSPPSRVNVPTTTPQPALVLDKQVVGVSDTNASGLTDAGDVVSWQFVVRNTGNVPVRQVQVRDPLLAAGALCTLGTLAPGATAACGPFTHVVDEADEAAGSVQNTATVRGLDPDAGTVESPPDTTSVPVTTPQPGLVVLKTAGVPVDVNASGLTDAGDTMRWTFTVTNSGNVPLREVAVHDPKLVAAGVATSCSVTVLAPGASTTCESGDYRITQQDVEATAVLNSATVGATDPDGDPVTSPPDSTTTPTTRPAPALTVDKVAGTPVDVNDSGITDAGDTLTWTFTVTNTGNVPVHQIRIDDAMLAADQVTVTCPVTSLAPGASTECVSAPYRVLAADVSAGTVANTARAAGTDPDRGTVSSPPDSTSVPVTAPRPASTLVKSVVRVDDVNESGITDAPDEIWYAFTVRNTGNVPLAALEIDDPLLGDVPVTCDSAALDGTGRLAVGAAVVCTAQAPYVVTGADERADQVLNRAVARSTDPDDRPVASPPDEESVPTTRPWAALTVDKVAGTPVDVNTSGITDAGDTIAFTFLVTNTGNVPVRAISVTDPLLTRAGLDLVCPAPRLAVGASMTCAASGPYVVTEADEIASHVANTATVGGEDPDGEPVTSPPDSTDTPVTLPQPGVSVRKQATARDTNASGNTDRGDAVDFTFTVTNTGNVPVDQVRVTDPMLERAGVTVTCPTGRLAVGASVECTATGYTVTGADAQAGAVTNTATATTTDPDGDPVTSPPDRVTVPLVAPAPELTVRKHVTAPVDVDGDGRISTGDTVDYTFEVTNTGNVTLHDVTVSDPMLSDGGLTLACPGDTLAAGESMTCTVSGPWVLTQAQVDAGAVTNTATVTGQDPWEEPVLPTEDTVVVPVPREASLSLDKQAATPHDTNGNGRTDAGDTISYTFVVTNTGTSSVSQLLIQDPMLAAAGEQITCDQVELADGASATCTAEHRITVAEMDAGALDNTATAQGADPTGTHVTSNPDSTSTVLTGVQGISLVKKATLTDRDGDGAADIGEQVRYTFVVTNTGTVTATAVRVVDAMLTERGVRVSCPGPELAPGAAMTCSADLTVRASDADHEVLENRAHAQANTPTGQVLSSTVSTAVVRLDPQVKGVETENPGTDPDGPGGPGGPDGDLPETGGPAGGWLLAALGALAAGWLLVVRGRLGTSQRSQRRGSA